MRKRVKTLTALAALTLVTAAAITLIGRVTPQTAVIWREDSFKTWLYDTADQAEPITSSWLLIGCPVEIAGRSGCRVQVRVCGETGWVDAAHIAPSIPEGSEAPVVAERIYVDKEAAGDGMVFTIPRDTTVEVLGSLLGRPLVRYEGQLGLHEFMRGSYVTGGEALAPWLLSEGEILALCLPHLTGEYGLTEEAVAAMTRTVVYYNVIPGPVCLSVRFSPDEIQQYCFLINAEAKLLQLHHYTDSPGVG